MDERPLSVPEIRGLPPIPRDREAAYSPESYAAQYGITIDDALNLLENYGPKPSHHDIERAILRMFSADPELKERCLRPDIEEHRRQTEIRAEVEKKKAEERKLRIENARREREAKEKALRELEEEVKT